jgi:hypothetical protein
MRSGFAMLWRMTTDKLSLASLAGRAAVVHTVTYMLIGGLAAALLDYKSTFARPEMACWMRQLDDPLVMAGPLLQPLRGLVFALVLYPFRAIVFDRRDGWLLLWWLLVGLGVVNTFGPAPGSLEAMLYTVIPVPDQLKGYLEVVPQAGLFALVLVYWVRHPGKRWLTLTLGILFALTLALVGLGLLVRPGGA